MLTGIQGLLCYGIGYSWMHEDYFWFAVYVFAMVTGIGGFVFICGYYLFFYSGHVAQCRPLFTPTGASGG
jgi:hypothetical protein